MKKRPTDDSPWWGKIPQSFLRKMKLTLLLSFLVIFQVGAVQYSNAQKRVSLDLQDVSLEEFFSELRRQTGNVYVFNVNEIQALQHVSVKSDNELETDVLDRVLRDLKLGYKVVEDYVVIFKLQARDEEKKSLTLKGFVYDEKQQPMPGVTVQVIGTSVGTATTEKGWFAITLPVLEGELKFSFIGYEDQLVKFSDRTDTLRIYMKPNVEELDEAIVVGYGTTTKRETTGSITVIKGDELKGIPSSNLATLLQGRVAGMDITQMSGSPGGGGTSIVVRGYNSLDVEQGRRFSNPLWVVDGVPLNSFTSPVTGTNLLADINPDMIESIQILKDASAASIYGSRAANGVIIVTTKKGNKNQDATFSVNASTTWSILPRLPGVTIGRYERYMRLLALRNAYRGFLDKDQLMYRLPTSLKEIYKNNQGSLDANWIPYPTTPGTSSNGTWLQDSLNPFYNNATNFFPMYYETSHITNANIQAYGGSERMTYGLGLGYYDEGGVLKGTGFKRVDLSMNMNVMPVKKFTIDARFNASIVNRKRGTNAGSSLGAAPSIETVPGDPFQLSTLSPGAGSIPWEAALENLRGTKETNRNIRLRTNFVLGYKVIEGLDVSASLAADYSIARRNYFQPSYLSNEGWSQSIGETSINMMVLTEELATYKKSFNDEHNFTLMAGFSYQYDQVEYNGGYAMNSPSDKIYYAPSGLPDYTIKEEYWTEEIYLFKHYQSDMQEKSLISYFARLEYNFRQKYLFSVAFRRDGSSTFGEDCRWGTFPSIAAGWSFSEEPFVRENLGWLSFGKIRASWGRSGMHFDYPYLALGIVQNGPNFQGNGSLSPDFTNGLYNDDLSWENTDQYDFGLDLDLFNYKVGVVFDYYYRYTDDLLMRVPLSNPNTYAMQWRNAAAISNEGVELLVKFDVLQKDDLYWRISVNGAKNWNKFRKSYSGYDESGWIIGKPLNGVYVMLSDGFVDTFDELPIVYSNSEGWKSYMGSHGSDGNSFFMPGDVKYIDVNGDGSANGDDAVYVGSALPEISGGLVTEFQWKNVDVTLSMAYQVGRHIINDLPFPSLSGLVDPFIMDIQGTKFWEKPGDDADYASWVTTSSFSHFTSGVDRYVEKVNWLKLKTLSVGYTFPGSWMKKAGIKELRVFASGENLFSWHNYSGLDPETVNITTGYDRGRNYPLARKLTLGLTLKF